MLMTLSLNEFLERISNHILWNKYYWVGFIKIKTFDYVKDITKIKKKKKVGWEDFSKQTSDKVLVSEVHK